MINVFQNEKEYTIPIKKVLHQKEISRSLQTNIAEHTFSYQRLVKQYKK